MMNERIRELVKQATTYIEPTATSGEGWIFDKEKFAELIVRECISQIEKQGNGLTTSTEWDEGYRAGLNASQKATKKHFGVEE